MTQPQLPFRLSICGLDELPAFAAEGVSHVVSILDPDYPDPEDFAAFLPHRRAVLRFDDVIVTGDLYQAPGAGDVAAILNVGRELAADGATHVLVHCHAGVSRSTAAAALLLAQRMPDAIDDVFDEIHRVRPRSWPNSLIVRLGDAQLGLAGRLVAAMQRHHARVAVDYPELAKLLRMGMRAHEVPDPSAPTG
ncbi:MAG: dual specificity protein phosphatase family protein [Rhodospirillaceae bacterium]|nr:dual specificity protein phosphatase family protein [Rhodospirillaceae bacterium]MCA8934273.1 dual specificity protein phosphatase family protein [Rhodospirillaceae bacterium]